MNLRLDLTLSVAAPKPSSTFFDIRFLNKARGDWREREIEREREREREREMLFSFCTA
jgi:hypothetical protein